jgi:alkylhydroperoxidase family enzyme
MEQELMRFAERLTASPREFKKQDTDRLRDVLRDEGEVIEAANVVAGFNFANRVADALDVSKEIPKFLENRQWLYLFAMRVMSWAMRLRMNFERREIPDENPENTLKALQEDFRDAGMGVPPPYFEYVHARSYILAQHAEVHRSLLLNNMLPKHLFCRVGLLVSALNWDWNWARNWVSLLSDLGTDPGSLECLSHGEIPNDASLSEATVLALTRQITVDASQTTDQQIEALRQIGFSDRQVLGLVLVIAGVNAANRLNLALAPAMDRGMRSAQVPASQQRIDFADPPSQLNALF